MNDTVYAALARMPARQLHLLAAGIVAIAAMGTWTLAVRAPWMTLRTVQARLVATPAAPASAAAAPRAAAPALTQLERAAAARAAGPDSALGLIGAIDASARRHGVAVTAAQPLPVRTVAGLRELPLDVQASGTYAALQAWLAAIERDLPAAALGQVDLQPGTAANRREAKVHVALYLPAVQP